MQAPPRGASAPSPSATSHPSGSFGLALLVGAVVTMLCSVQPYMYPHTVWQLERHSESLQGMLGEALCGRGAGHEAWWACDRGGCDVVAEGRWAMLGRLRRAGPMDVMNGDGGSGMRGGGGIGSKEAQTGSGVPERGGVRGTRSRRLRDSKHSVIARADETWVEEGQFGVTGEMREEATAGEEPRGLAGRVRGHEGRSTGNRQNEETQGHTGSQTRGGPGSDAVSDDRREHLVVGLNMSLIPFTGWGNLAYALFFGSLDDPSSPLYPILLTHPPDAALQPPAPHSERLSIVVAQQQTARAQVMSSQRTSHPIIHSVDHEHFDASKVRGSPNIALIFFDTFRASRALLRSASKRYDCFVVGSSWNAAMLRSRGLPHRSKIYTIIQGVDLDVFHPQGGGGDLAGLAQVRVTRKQQGVGRRPERLRGRFVVFSGGKFELRKGQDLVVAAFKSFRSANPSAKALLLFSWNNAWPIRWYSSIGGGSGYTQGVPSERLSGGHDFMEWLGINNVSDSEAFDLGTRSPTEMAEAMRWADVAVFPNRCEGGTNLVAMEAMASGVASILSNNTGHMDLIAAGCSQERSEAKAGCVALRHQRKLVASKTGGLDPYEGWGESEIKEVVQAMERLWKDQKVRQNIANRGATLLRKFSWQKYRERMLDVLMKCPSS